MSHGALLVAGGANFPNAKPWEGGTKVWSDAVFLFENGRWTVAGRLPRPLGYGVSATHRQGVICAGGSDAGRHYAAAFRLEWRGGKLATTELPPLPRPIANACGALVGDHLYLAGGQERPDDPGTLNTAFRLDLSAAEPEWTRLETWPGPPRMLATAAGFDGKFWLAGGVDLARTAGGTTERRYLQDAYRFDPAAGWDRIADLPVPIAAAPSPAPAHASGFDLLGGDDGSQMTVAPIRHRGFRKSVLRYDATAGIWIDAGPLPFSHVTTPCVPWSGAWVVPSGEVRPGVRSPDVWQFDPEVPE